MKNSWFRLSLVAGALVVMGAGAQSLGKNIARMDTKPCKKEQAYCSRSCADSPYPGVGACREGKNGPTSALSIECCCCTEGWENRYFIGG